MTFYSHQNMVVGSGEGTLRTSIGSEFQSEISLDECDLADA